MIIIKLKDMVKVTEGTLINQSAAKVCSRIEIDSRRVDRTSYFMPILGEVHDGHKFILGAFENGAPMSFCEKAYYYSHYDELSHLPLILVDNTTKALHRLTTFVLKKLNIKTIGVTGSVGKTSTKEFLYHVLSQSYNVHKNKGNFNNHIGLPLTVLDLQPSHEIAILEMGMNHFKEIETLVDIARPSIGVITNIGTSHIGILGSKENIFQAKMEMTSYFDKKSVLILNGEDDYLSRVSSGEFKLVKVGVGEPLEAVDVTLQENGCYAYKTIFKEVTYDVRLNVLGKHNILNSLLAIAVGVELGIPFELIVKGVEAFVDNDKRLVVYNLAQHSKVISDCYNASQESMISALDVLTQTAGHNKIAVLGDVLELGQFSQSSHEAVGEYVFDKAVDHIVTYGDASAYITSKAIELGYDKKSKHFKDEAALLEYLKSIMTYDSVILVKGSLGMGMQSIVESLKELGE